MFSIICTYVRICVYIYIYTSIYIYISLSISLSLYIYTYTSISPEEWLQTQEPSRTEVPREMIRHGHLAAAF